MGRSEDKEDIVCGQPGVLREKQVSNSLTLSKKIRAVTWFVHTWDIVHTHKEKRCFS